MILENDLPSVESIEYESIYKLRKLLYHISVSVPFKPNISKLAEIIQTNRNALMHYFKILEKAELIHQLLPMGRDAGVMRKAEKIYLQNTNVMYALAPGHCEIGQVRQCFLLNQLKNAHQVKAALYGDFLVNEKYILEVDGKNKTNRQIKNYQNAFLVKDQIEIGNRQTIPIWLFGMLY
ncbi:MAG: hypothetical protein IPM92_17390 [Saprospiraceae bacterium]|nr:hypothetical protein [Saprospiraceae bacterium]